MILPALPASVTARTMPGPASESKPTMPVRFGWPWMMAAVLAATCSTLVPDSSSATTVTPGQFVGERIAQTLAGGDEVARGEERDGADLAGLEPRFLVVAALVEAVLVAEVVPVGAEIGQALRRGEVAVGDDRRDLLVDALVDFRGESVVPAADDDDAGRVLGAFGVDRGDEGGKVDRGRAGDADLDVQRLARRLQPRIDPLDEERQVRGVADPDIFLVAAARVPDRNVKTRRLGRRRPSPDRSPRGSCRHCPR